MSPKREHAGASWRNTKDAVMRGAHRGGENRYIREDEETRAQHLKLLTIDELLANWRTRSGREGPRAAEEMPDDDNQ